MATDNTNLYKYRLVNLYTDKAVCTVELTEWEAACKNYAFGLNGAQTRYVKI